MTDDPRDAELETAFRQGLRRAGEKAEVAVPLAARAVAGARTRRRRRWAGVGAVTAVVVLAGGTGLVRATTGGDAPRDRTATRPTSASAPVTAWRPESWHGLTVDVPADWGWGTAPLDVTNVSGDQGYYCGSPGAELGVDGRHPSDKRHAAWVGRPIMLSDSCMGYTDEAVPEASYVWFDADLPVGTTELGDGYVQETVDAFGSRLTVATQDPAVREHVLDSARATSDCDATLASRPTVEGMPTEGLDPVHSARLCAYEPGNDGLDLVYAGTLDQATAQSLYTGKALGSTNQQAFCDSKFHEYVLVRFSGKDRMGDAELTSDWVVEPGCQQVELGPGLVVALKDSGMTALTQGTGLPVVLHSFIGMLG